MINPEQQMIDAQAAQITKLNTQVQGLREQLQRAQVKLASIELNAKFYDILQKAIIDNPSLQSEWDSFMMMMRLAIPEVEEEFKDAVRLCRMHSDYFL